MTAWTSSASWNRSESLVISARFSKCGSAPRRWRKALLFWFCTALRLVFEKFSDLGLVEFFHRERAGGAFHLQFAQQLGQRITHLGNLEAGDVVRFVFGGVHENLLL